MTTKILLRRGSKADLPNLDQGECGVTSDTNEVFIGSANGNILVSVPSGAMMDYAGTSAPTGWLMCDGSAVSRTTYANLFNAIGTSYGVGNGSSTFNLPDFRGRFARYMDNMGTAAGAAGRDSNRVLGEAQSDLIKSHTHPTDATKWWGTRWTSSFTSTVVGSDVTVGHGSASVSASGGTETRPINLSCNRIIKI